jgi:phage FluMu gp28-like protein
MSIISHNPLDLLLPYQRRFVEDDSRFKIWLASRQVGKSFAAACEVTLDCMRHPGAMWIILSAGERQALEMMEKVKQWLKAWELVLEWEGLERDAAGEFKSAEARLKNGSRIIALPANADTARGYSANLVLDEFAFHRDPAAIWRAIFPTISNPLKGALKVRIMSTPNGQGGQGSKFYDLWANGGAQWSRHKTTIEDAAANGLRVNIEQLREASGDAEGFAQEYLCQFIDSSRVAFPYDLIAGCEEAAASVTWNGKASGLLFCGIDIGTVSDPTACVTLERLAGRLWVREVISLRGVALSDQDALLAPRIERAAVASIDASGIGRDLAQRMLRRYGGKCIAQTVTSTWKRIAFQRLVSAMSDRRIALPVDRQVRDDLHSYEVFGAGENAQYHAKRTDDGHSDMTSGLVHALDAASQPSTAFFAPVAAPRVDRASLRVSTRRRNLGALS